MISNSLTESDEEMRKSWYSTIFSILFIQLALRDTKRHVQTKHCIFVKFNFSETDLLIMVKYEV